MTTGSILALVTPLAIVAGAGIAWAGNLQAQRRIHHQVRLRQGVDDVKQRLHEFVDLSAKYWTLDAPRAQTHRTLEAHMIARKRIIQEEFSGLGSRSTRLNQSYLQTRRNRLNLWKAATGGCFQQTKWAPDPERVIQVAAEACRIVRSLSQAH